MDITTLLEAFQDFEKRGKKETIPLLEQFLCHVAKTGQPLVPWTQFKPYFMFKLESIMDNFNASVPEQRPIHNPNVEYVPFEEMKKRILKIVDSYNGIPFTIQRLCELVNDPKRNYTRPEKFLRGLEKNVMVVSCVCPTLEKHGASNANRMNGVMFSGNSLYSDSRNMNGPSSPKPFNRPRLSLSSSFSTNGLPQSRESESTTEKAEDNISDTALSEAELSPNIRTKNKYQEEEEEGEEQSLDRHEVKRLKSERKDDRDESEEKGPSFCKGPESLSEALQSCSEENTSDTSCGTPAISENKESFNITTEICENQDYSSEDKAPQSEMTDTTVDRQELDISKTNTGSEQNDLKSCDSDGEEPVPSSSSSSDLTTDGDADSSNNLQTEIKPEEQD